MRHDFSDKHVLITGAGRGLGRHLAQHLAAFGAFVGVAASDLNGTALHADFDSFNYRPQRHSSDRYDI